GTPSAATDGVAVSIRAAGRRARGVRERPSRPPRGARYRSGRGPEGALDAHPRARPDAPLSARRRRDELAALDVTLLAVRRTGSRGGDRRRPVPSGREQRFTF